jgi:ABC-type transporter Mla subunit MlaD
MTRLGRGLVALVVLAAFATGAAVLVRNANGDYAGDYRLTGYFPRAGEGLQPGSEVVFRGVQVGRVSAVSLAGDRARITVLIEPTFRVPADAVATVEPVNLFGAEQVSLTTPPAGLPAAGPSSAVAAADGTESDAGPYLAPGGTFAHTVSSDEIGDLFAAAAPLLEQVDTRHLADVITDLAQISDGEGPRIARSIDAGADLAGYLDQTLGAQLDALDSFSRFTASLAPDGTAVNGLSAAENAALPAFNEEAADYQRLLGNLTTFSDELAQLLADYHPTIATLLADGDDVAKVLVSHQTDVGQVIAGAYLYAFKVGSGGSADTLPDGSKFAYFNTFILFSDVNTLVCDLITPDQPGLAFLEPLQQAVAGSGTAFNCQGQLSAFDAAQATGPAPTPAPPAATAVGAPATPAPPSPVTAAVDTLGGAVYRILGQPTAPAAESVGGYLHALLGGSS